MYPRSLRGIIKLVMMSAKKKCLNLTIPKGEITMFQMVYASATLPLRKMQWKGYTHIAVNTIRTARVKAATAFSKRNSNFKMKVWHIRQKAQIAKSIVATYITLGPCFSLP